MRLGFTCTLRCYTPSLFDTLFCDLQTAWRLVLSMKLWSYIWLEFGLFSTIIAIIRACACWALFVVTLTNTVHLIYIYICTFCHSSTLHDTGSWNPSSYVCCGFQWVHIYYLGLFRGQCNLRCAMYMIYVTCSKQVCWRLGNASSGSVKADVVVVDLGNILIDALRD